MKATVVIPTYERSTRLRALLECLAHQAGDALARVVVCDDGSADDTEAVARSFETRLPLVYRWQADTGFRAGQARNLGIEDSLGEVIVFVDDDVLVRPDFVASHVAAHAALGAEQPSVAIGYRYRTSRFDGAVPSQQDLERGERDDRLLELEVPVEQHPLPWLYVYSCNFSVRAAGLTAPLRFHDGFVGWGMEDTELGYRLHRAGYAIVEASAARVLHVEDPAPRDPFRCEVRELAPSYDSYVLNAVYFMDLHPQDTALRDFVRGDLRWYVEDDDGRWVKNGYANDVDRVIAACRKQLAERHPTPSSRTPSPGRAPEILESA